MGLFVPQRSPSGVCTQPFPGNTCLWGDYVAPCPVDTYNYFNDFSTYAAGDWTVTTTGGSSALTPGNGGFLLQTTGAASGNTQANEQVSTPLNFIVATPQRYWFAINFQMSSVGTTTFLAGWVNTLAAMAPTSGVYFSKVSGSQTLNIILNKGGVTTTVAVGTIAAATPYTIGWYYDARSTSTLFVYSTIGLTLPYTRQGTYQIFGGAPVVSIGGNSAANPSLANLPLPATALKLGYGVQPNSAASITGTYDYVFTASQINRF